MCGIVGLFNFGGPPRDELEDLGRMRDAMRHRGPDDAGVYQNADRRVALGHRRLSILDLSEAGRQPMGNEDGSVQITFNGEIYNCRKLAEGLAERGHRFRSKTDTEAIVHLFEEKGPDCLADLDGMFAFGIWDGNQRRLVLARDRLGKKPLYYTATDGRLLFASEIKALLAYPGVPRDLDLEAVSQYLTFANVPAPRTLFKGISKLPAAHRLICDEHGNIRVEAYWSPLGSNGDGHWDRAVSEVEAVERVRHLVERAVEKRLISDVPIGALLSGGIDSSTNVALMSRLCSEPLRTFSIGFDGFGEEQNFHDLPYARRVAERFGCRHSELTLTPKDVVGYLPEFVYQSDEPVGDPACLPMYFICKFVKEQGVTVVLVGEGSDEVFGGYGDMVQLAQTTSKRWAWLKRVPRPVRELIYQAGRRSSAADGRVDLLRRAARNEPLYWGLDVVFWDTEKQRLLKGPAAAQLAHGSATVVQGYYDTLRRTRPRADFLQQMSFVELSNRLPELLLMRVDKLSMAASLEARAPFLDAELVSYVLSLPMGLKIAGGQTKHILKKAVRSLLPDEVIDRPKQGFRVPLPAWLAGELSSWAEHVLFGSAIHKRDLFNLDYIRGMWERHRAGVQDHSFDLWCLINLGAWYDRWIEGVVR